MLRTWRAVIIGVSVAACAHADGPSADRLSAASARASVRACPPGRVQANAHAEGFGPQSGVTTEDIAFTPLSSDPTRAMRLRRIVLAPGGVIAWHDHVSVQGMALVMSGEATERRNTCLDEMIYRAGDVAREDAETAHSWRNDGDEPATILVAHVVPVQ